MGRRQNKFYNTIVNTVGISKEMIFKYIDERLEDLITKHVTSKLDSKRLEKMILDKVTQVVVEGIPRNDKIDWWIRDDFDKYLMKTIRKVLEEKFNSEYNLEVKVVQKDTPVVHKV